MWPIQYVLTAWVICAASWHTDHLESDRKHTSHQFRQDRLKCYHVVSVVMTCKIITETAPKYITSRKIIYVLGGAALHTRTHPIHHTSFLVTFVRCISQLVPFNRNFLCPALERCKNRKRKDSKWRQRRGKFSVVTFYFSLDFEPVSVNALANSVTLTQWRCGIKSNPTRNIISVVSAAVYHCQNVGEVWRTIFCRIPL